MTAGLSSLICSWPRQSGAGRFEGAGSVIQTGIDRRGGLLGVEWLKGTTCTRVSEMYPQLRRDTKVSDRRESDRLLSQNWRRAASSFEPSRMAGVVGPLVPLNRNV
jgi:hypothetical protein